MNELGQSPASSDPLFSIDLPAPQGCWKGGLTWELHNSNADNHLLFPGSQPGVLELGPQPSKSSGGLHALPTESGSYPCFLLLGLISPQSILAYESPATWATTHSLHTHPRDLAFLSALDSPLGNCKWRPHHLNLLSPDQTISPGMPRL